MHVQIAGTILECTMADLQLIFRPRLDTNKAKIRFHDIYFDFRKDNVINLKCLLMNSGGQIWIQALCQSFVDQQLFRNKTAARI